MNYAEAEARMRRWIAIAVRDLDKKSVLARVFRGRASDFPSPDDWRTGDFFWERTAFFGKRRVRGRMARGVAKGPWSQWQRGMWNIEAEFDGERCVALTLRNEVSRNVVREERFREGALVESFVWAREGAKAEHGGGGLRDGRKHGAWRWYDAEGGLLDGVSGEYADGVRISPLALRDRLVGIRDVETRRAVAREVASRVEARSRGVADQDQVSKAWDEGAILAFVCDEDPVTQSIVRAAVRFVLRERTAIELEDLARKCIQSWFFDSRRADTLARMEALLAAAPDATLGSAAFLVADSFDPDGYVREAAVKHLATRTSTDVVGCLLMRLSDWVDPVRVRATKAIAARIDERHVHDFARELPTIEALRGRSRASGSSILRDIDTLWSTATGAAALRAAMGSANRVTRRAAARITFESGSDTLAAAESALDSRDAGVRFAAARALPRLSSGPDLDRWIESFAADRSLPIRREALRQSWNSSGVFHVPFEQGLLDRHASIRELARFYATQSHAVDVDEFYRRASEDPSTARRTLALLGWIEASPNDAVAARVRAEIATARGRRAAALFTALARRADVSDVPLFLEWVMRDQGSASSAAARALERTGAGGELAPALESLAQSVTHAHAAGRVIRLARRIGKWRELAVVLAVVARADERGRERALEAIAWWCRRVDHSVPSLPAELAEVVRTRLRAARGLSDAHRAEITAQLRFAEQRP